jgi:hypothetical protein
MTTPPNDQLLWHYTTQQSLAEILRDGFIKLATDGVPAREKPAVWFSSNQEWEETVNQTYQTAMGRVWCTREELSLRRGGLARIGVLPSTATDDWCSYRAKSGILPIEAEQLCVNGRKAGASPDQWFVSFEPVGSNHWVAVELWEGQQWHTHPNWHDRRVDGGSRADGAKVIPVNPYH